MRYFFVCSLSFFFAACVSTQPVRYNEVFAVSKKVLGKGHSVVVLPRSEVNSGELGESVKAVAGYFSEGEARTTRIAIASASAEATAKVIKESLALNENKDLSKLTILYFGKEQYSEGVKQAVQAAGGRYIFRELNREQESEAPANE
jgi:hypothetical protein